ncbi:MAG: HD-GYP domain-containing protein [Gammaproteobacteria bacterium]
METQKQIKVNTADLEVGMYVARLDRPWTETPFLFQGFFIRNQDEIEELRHHCRYVFVDFEQTRQDVTRTRTDISRGNRTITQVTSLHYPAARRASNTRNRNRTVYANSQPVEKELPVARTIYVEANRAVQDLIIKLETDGRLDVQMARETVEPMVESVLRNPDAMIWLSRMKKHDSYMYHHSVGAAIWGITFGRHLGLDKSALYEIGLGCMLFDVGKTKLPHELLMKAGGLTETEWHVMRNHVDYSLNLLEGASGITERITSMVRSHHERYDGSGYPDKLKGDQIPTFAKIAGMADCYDAITSPRPYSKMRSPYEAVREIYSWRGSLFQPEVVEQFMQVVGVFPTGSLVELNTGAVAVVIAQNETRRLKPRVMLILDENKRRLPQFNTLDLLFDTHLKGVETLWIEKCLDPGAYGVDPQELYL